MIGTAFNLGPVINFIIEKIGWVFGELQSFEILGTNMLAFWLTLSVIGVLLPIIFTIGKSIHVPNQNGHIEKYYPRHGEGRLNAPSGKRSDRYK